MSVKSELDSAGGLGVGVDVIYWIPGYGVL